MEKQKEASRLDWSDGINAFLLDEQAALTIWIVLQKRQMFLEVL